MTPLPKPEKRGPKPPRPIQRTAPIARRSSRRPKVTARDLMWSAAVKAPNLYRCELGHCGGDMAHDAHHVRSKKAHPKLRYRLENGVALCRSCHMWAHAHPKGFRAWFKRVRPKDYAEIYAVEGE